MYENIFTSTQLKTNLREVKQAAEKDVVYITENGVVAYEFMSLEIYNGLVRRAQAEARWEVSVNNVVRWASREFEDGQYEDDGRVLRTRTFLESLTRGDILHRPSGGMQVIEYFSNLGGSGIDITDSLTKDHFGQRAFGDRAFKVFFMESDLIYLLDSPTGRILLCGLVPTVERFEELAGEVR